MLTQAEELSCLLWTPENQIKALQGFAKLANVARTSYTWHLGNLGQLNNNILSEVTDIPGI